MGTALDHDDWIAVDWGTSNLRIWVMRGTQIIARLTSDQGMGRITPHDYEAVLLDLVEPHLGCGDDTGSRLWHGRIASGMG